MAKYFGTVGYAEQNVETRPGVYEDVIVERKYYGDVLRNTRKLSETAYLNNDITVNNSISIVADAYATENFFKMKYITWAGTLWVIADAEVQAPRLILRLGGVYNGPRAEA